MIYIILLSGILLRLISINQSLWLDEATSALVSKMTLADIFTKFLPNDFHPPLYYLILKFWVTIFGNSEIFLRIPSIIFGTATIYVIYLIAKKIFNQKVGIISGLLFATSGLAIYYSQEARMYMLTAFLVSLAFYLILENKWIIFSIILVLIGLTDYVSLLIIPVFFLIYFKKWKKLLLSLVPLSTVFALWLPIFQKQLFNGFQQEGTAWWKILGIPTFKNIVLIPVKFMLGRISFQNDLLYGFIVIVVSAIFAFLLWNSRKTNKLIWTWLLVPVFLGVILSFKIPTLTYFRFLFVLPVFYILVANGITNLGNKWKIFMIIVLIINLASTFYYLFNPKFWREDWRMAVKNIGNNKIVIPSNSQTEALIYYGKQNQIVYYTNFLGKEKEIWLSRYVWNIFDPNDLAAKRLIDLGYNKIAEVNFGGIVFFKYENSN